MSRPSACPITYLVSHRRAKVTVLGMALASVLAIAMIPVRDRVGPANIALVLAIDVTLVGTAEGLLPGLLVAFWVSGLFTLLHAVPHGHPWMEDGQEQRPVTRVASPIGSAP